MNNDCPLCHNDSTDFYRGHNGPYHQCKQCKGVFLDKTYRTDKQTEKSRYLNHNNDVDDKGYQQFVSPITSAVIKQQTKQQQGLDFGAGPGPVIAKLLSDNQFNIELYDPFFHNNPKLLEKTYDFIVCCEVMEHFYQPDKEFELLKGLLKDNSRLYCMTDMYHEDIDFHKWYYKNDATHVFFYHPQSLDYIKQKLGFSDLTIDGRLIIFSN